MSAPIAVGFDFDHTLGVDNELESAVGGALLLELAAECGRPLALDEARAMMRKLLARFRQGDATLGDAFAEELSSFDPRLDAADAERRFRAVAVTEAPSFVRPLPGASELLTWLHANGIPTAVLTNGWSPLQNRKIELIGFEGPVLVSETIGARKPHRDAFARLVDVFPVGLEVWYVGDDPLVDIVGAAAAGLRAIWFDREGRAYPPDGPPPSAIVHALDAVRAVLAQRLASHPQSQESSDRRR